MYKEVLNMVSRGFSLSWGRVSITHIRGFIPRIHVESDDYRCRFSDMYQVKDIDIAVDKFILLINQVKNAKSKKTNSGV